MEVSPEITNERIDSDIATLEYAKDDIEGADTARDAFDIYIKAVREVLNDKELFNGYVEDAHHDKNAFREAEQAFADTLQSPNALWEQIGMMLGANELGDENDTEGRHEYVAEGMVAWLDTKIGLLEEIYL